MPHLNIAIDGPAGAGKSTVAKQVAKRLGLLYIDTGAMYRAVAWLASRFGVPVGDEQGVVNLLHRHSLHFERSDDGTLDIFYQEECINEALRNPAISASVSQLSVHPLVREILTNWQQEFGHQYSVVMDGRDIGTVVLPEAEVKIFLTASLEERTERRAQELREKGFEVAVDELRASIRERDLRDSSRPVAPLRPAEDANTIDSSGKSVDEVVEEILDLVERKVQ